MYTADNLKDFQVENIVLDCLGGLHNYQKNVSRLAGSERARIKAVWNVSEAQLNRVLNRMEILK